MTEVLYVRDSYLKEFDATVTAVDGQAVALDRTAFYPGGGGLPFDTGRVTWPGGEGRVVEVKRDGAIVWHFLDVPAPAAGTVVRGAIDWERRYGVMRHHTALHVLVGAVYRLFGALVTGGQIHPDRARMDFSLADLSKDRVAAIEDEANRVITEGHRVLIRFVSREEYERSDLTRLAKNLLPPDVTEVRVVEIEGYDAQADGGTHVASTAEIGRLRVTKTENKGKTNRRLEIVLENPGE
jgi:Ser-tRNA(Ala) deacylase AlaX